MPIDASAFRTAASSSRRLCTAVVRGKGRGGGTMAYRTCTVLRQRMPCFDSNHGLLRLEPRSVSTRTTVCFDSNHGLLRLEPHSVLLPLPLPHLCLGGSTARFPEDNRCPPAHPATLVYRGAAPPGKKGEGWGTSPVAYFRLKRSFCRLWLLGPTITSKSPGSYLYSSCWL